MGFKVETQRNQSILAETMEVGAYCLGLNGYVQGFANNLAMSRQGSNCLVDSGLMIVDGKKIYNLPAFTIGSDSADVMLAAESGAVTNIYNVWILVDMTNPGILQVDLANINVNGGNPSPFYTDDIFSFNLQGMKHVLIGTLVNNNGGVASAQRTLPIANISDTGYNSVAEFFAFMQGQFNTLNTNLTNQMNALTSSTNSKIQDLTNQWNAFKTQTGVVTVANYNNRNGVLGTALTNLAAINSRTFREETGSITLGLGGGSTSWRRFGRVVYFDSFNLTARAYAANSDTHLFTFPSSPQPIRPQYQGIVAYGLVTVSNTAGQAGVRMMGLGFQVNTQYPNGRLYIHNWGAALGNTTQVVFPATLWHSAGISLNSNLAITKPANL